MTAAASRGDVRLEVRDAGGKKLGNAKAPAPGGRRRPRRADSRRSRKPRRADRGPRLDRRVGVRLGLALEGPRADADPDPRRRRQGAAGLRAARRVDLVLAARGRGPAVRRSSASAPRRSRRGTLRDPGGLRVRGLQPRRRRANDPAPRSTECPSRPGTRRPSTRARRSRSSTSGSISPACARTRRP